VAWDVDGDGFDDGSGVVLRHAFVTEGPHEVKLQVDDGPDPPPPTEVPHTVNVGNAPPVASFEYSPTQPNPDEWILFTSTSTDCGDSLSFKWDFDDDGVTDSTAASPTYKFITPGPHDVALTVSDGDVTDTEVHTVDVRDPSAPTAAFHRDPPESVVLEAGQAATFTSDSTALAGSTLSWEIDGAQVGGGQSVTHTFSTSGWHIVRLTVTQPDGKSDDTVSVFQVAARAAPIAIPPAAPALMKPFPTVRFVGFVVPKGARITLVEIRGSPRGARITVDCTGKGCPFRSRRRVAETPRVRFTSFKRVLKAGTRIEVFVRAPGVIGKYTSFRIRAGKRPLRADRCLMPGASKPTPCT
jgi:PKD repeat protein